ncbi:Armadillo-like helical [Corchorus olitorius]|uniref:Armadillo-like helical n=1 Tax=Corchorus olitorius TaxID=93759 RepID=A0A1R3J637_9ROSI|nr:Armadillo-like helical [Corchorus olitorius]
MAPSAPAPTMEEEEEQEEQFGEDRFVPSHHPSAPPDEVAMDDSSILNLEARLFDISTTVDPSYVISLIRKLLPTDAKNGDNVEIQGSHCNEVESSPNDKCKSMEIVDDFSKSDFHGEDEENSSRGGGNARLLAGEEVWEECGCVLWDLAANQTHAELMVQNLVLEVLLANLMVTQSVRVTEICLGIMGNLACHKVPMKHIVSTNGLIPAIVDQLFLDDTQCLCEAFRLLSSGLQGGECIIWAEALQSEQILSRILWVAENALNPQLIEKCVGLLLAMLESQKEVVHILLSPLMKLGLANVLLNLLAFEMSKLMKERIPERYPTPASLSVMFLHKSGLYVKFEWALMSWSYPDVPFLQGLFDIFPFTSDDIEARSALWSILARLLVRVQEDEMDASDLRQYVLILLSKSDLIEDDLFDHQFDENKENESLTTSKTLKNCQCIVLVCPCNIFVAPDLMPQLKRIINILNNWNALQDSVEEKYMMEEDANGEDIRRLLDLCCKYIA